MPEEVVNEFDPLNNPGDKTHEELVALQPPPLTAPSVPDTNFVVLGIHGEDVTTVNDYGTNERGEVVLVKVNNVARIRIFLSDKYDDYVDEDFELPSLPNGVPPTEEVYRAFLTSAVNKRAKELGSKK